MTVPHARVEFRWVIIAFALCGLIVAAFAGWQLWETTPARWCAIAQAGTPESTTACLSVLLKILEIKGNAVMILLGILGMTVIGVSAAALNLNVKASAPGGASVDLGHNSNNES